MNTVELIALLPIMTLAAAAVAVMLLAAFKARHDLLNAMALLGLLLTLASLILAATAAPIQVTPLLMVDHFALFYSALMVCASMVVILLSGRYLTNAKSASDCSQFMAEYYILLLTALLGAMVLVASRHFASFFIGLELLSVSLHVLVAYLAPLRPARLSSLEAGIKYLILSGVASALLLFGIALLYAEFGTLDLQILGGIWALLGDAGNANEMTSGIGSTINSTMVLIGLALLISGIGFKLSLIPFHMWAPDVYEGAPAPIAAFVATVSKGAVFAFILRLFIDTNAFDNSVVCAALAVVALLSMVAGNLLALLQNNIKRLLAYSSIAHLGYLLVILLAGSSKATGTAFVSEAVAFYLLAYFITTLGAFGVVTALSTADAKRDCDAISDYQGLYWRAPGLAIILTVMLLSLAGIPLTVGFIGEFYVVLLAVQASMWVLLGGLVVASVIGLYYYLRIIVAIFSRDQQSVEDSPLRIARGDQLVLLLLVLLLVWLGVYPDPAISLIQAAGIG